MRKESPAAKRIRLLEQAKDGYLRAAAALTEHWTRENLEFAMLEGILALMRMCEADPDHVIKDRLEARVMEERSRRAP